MARPLDAIFGPTLCCIATGKLLEYVMAHAVRVYVGAEEDPERERRCQSASAHAGGDIVDMVVCRTVQEAVAQPLGWDRACNGPAK